MIKTLLIDDEPSFLDLAKTFLEKENDELDIKTISSPKKALKSIQSNRFDCIVCDYQMPEMTGLDILKKTRKELNNEIPFIIFTGKGREEVAIEALNLGADRYIQKGGNPKTQFGVLANAIVQEHKHFVSEEGLKKSEKEKTLVLDNLKELVGYHDMDHRLVWVNRAYAEAIGESVEDIRGKKCYETWLDREKPCPSCPVTEALRTGEERENEVSPPGEPKNWLIKGTPVYDEQNLIGAIEVTRDVPKSHCKVKELDRTKREYEELINGMNDTAWVISFEEDFLEINEAATKKLGYSKKELLSMKIRDIDVGLKPGKISELIKNIKKDKKQVFETKHQTKDGKRIPVEISSSLIDYRGKKAILSIARDITQRKEAEEREKFLYSLLGHDVRNKNQIAKGYLELWKNDKEGNEGYIQKTIDALEKSEEIIEEVKTLRELEENTKIIEINPSSLIEELVEEKRSMDKKKNIEIEFSCFSSQVKIKAGPLVKNICKNLINNSIKHSGANKIKISAEEKNGEVICSVIDDGKGIPKEIKDKVFRKGYKHGETAGTGLGLYLVKEIAEAYDGKVEVKDSCLGGARFDVYFQKA